MTESANKSNESPRFKRGQTKKIQTPDRVVTIETPPPETMGEHIGLAVHDDGRMYLDLSKLEENKNLYIPDQKTTPFFSPSPRSYQDQTGVNKPINMQVEIKASEFDSFKDLSKFYDKSLSPNREERAATT